MQDLSAILRIKFPSTICIVGAGGKTSTMLRIAQGLKCKVIVTTTTHISQDQANEYPCQIIFQDERDLPIIRKAFQEGIVCVTGPSPDGHRMGNVSADDLLSLKELTYKGGGVLVIEADGARMLPLKAPADHEPQIPRWCEHVIVCAGMSAVGKPLDKDHVFRPEIFSALTGIELSSAITTEAVAQEIIHPKGGMKDIPADSRVTVILNQADSETEQSIALRIARSIQHEQIDQILVSTLNSENSSAKVHARIERIAGIVLAAGGASRYGLPKQLLPVHGKPMLKHVIEQGLSAGLDPMIVVTGAFESQISQVLEGLPVTICNNSQWQNGQSASIKCGLSKVPNNCGGAIFLLADQPFLSDVLIAKMIEQVRVEMPMVLAPMADGRRANPVYFDQETFKDLMLIEGDTGGRAVFSKYPPQYFDWHDPSILIDIDKISDYEEYLRIINAE